MLSAESLLFRWVQMPTVYTVYDLSYRAILRVHFNKNSNMLTVKFQNELFSLTKIDTFRQFTDDFDIIADNIFEKSMRFSVR